MADYFSRRVSVIQGFTLTFMAIAFLTVSSYAQDDAAKDKPQRQVEENSEIVTGDEKEVGEFRTELEPGVIVFGQSNRFAEVGNTQSFDSSPDGRTLAFATSKIKFFDLQKNEVVGEAGESNEHYSKVLYSPDGRQVFATTQSGGKSIVRVFDAIDMTSTGTIDSRIEDGKKNHNFFHMQTLQVSADAKYVAFNSHDSIQVRNVSNGELAYHAKDIGYSRQLAFTPDEKYLIFAKNNKTVVVDIESGEEQKAEDWPMVGQYSTAMSVNLARNTMLCSFSGQSMSIYDFGDLEKAPISISGGKSSYIQSASFSDDGAMIAVSVWKQNGSGMAVEIVDVEKEKVTHELSIASQGEMNFRFSPGNQSVFVSGHGIFGVKEIPISNDSGIEDNQQPSGPAKILALHPSEEAFLACSEGGEVSWINTETGEVDRSIQKYNINSLEFNDDGSDVLIGCQWTNDAPISKIRYSDGKSIKTYSAKASLKKGGIFSSIRKFMVGKGPTANMEDREHKQTYSLAGNYSLDRTEVSMIAMTQTYNLVKMEDGNSWTTSEQKITIKIMRYDAESGRRIYESQAISPEVFGMSQSWIQIAAISPDGSQFSIGDNSQVYVIDAESGELLEKLKSQGGASNISKVHYSPDGKWLALANGNGVDVYDADSFELVYEHYEEKSGSPILAFSNDGKRMVVGSRKKELEISVLDTKSWKQVFSRSRTEAKRVCAALSGDGQKVLIGLGDCRVEMWDLTKVASK